MKRPEQHRIDAAAKAILMKNIPKRWSLAEPSEDYGIDYFVQVFDEDNDEATKISFIIQLKGTANYKKDENNVKFQISTGYLKHYYQNVSTPVFLVVVDVTSEECCWLFVQKYINEELNVKKPTWKSQKKVTLYIPLENTFSNPKIIEKSALEGSQYCNILVNGTPTQELIWKVENITDNPLKKSEDLKKKFAELYDAETRVGFEFIHNQNDPSNAEKSFQSVYDKTKDDEDNILPHLNSIIGLTPLLNWQNEEEQEKLFELIEEGEKLSEKHNITYLEHYFYGYRLEQICFIRQDQLQDLLITQKISNISDNILSTIMSVQTPQEIKRILVILHQLYLDFSTNLTEALDEGELFIFIELMKMLIGMKMQLIQVVYASTDEDTLNLLFDQIRQLISMFKKLIGLSDEFEIFKYDAYIFEITYLNWNGDEKYNELIEEFISFAEENKSEYNLKRAKSLKETISNPMKRKDTSKMSDEEIHDLYKTLILTIEGIDIDTDESDESIALRRGVKDLNPKRVLDHCVNLELVYGPSGAYPQFFGLYTTGFKTLYCIYGGIITNWSLDDAYNEFYNKYCKDCQHKKEQDFKWNPDKLNHVKTEEFKEILKKNPITRYH